MNKTKIEYGDYAWNPIRGCSGEGCIVKDKCWAKAINNRFKYITNWTKPGIDYKALYINHPKKSSRILTCFMGDIFDKGVNKWMRKKVYKVIEENKQHTYFLLTKHPFRMLMENELIPKNVFLGTTINKGSDLGRLADLVELRYFKKNIFISFEPLLSRIDFMDSWGYAIDWIIIGGMQGGREPTPKKEWIENILYIAKTKHNIPIWMKDNLKNVWNGKLRQEFPNLT